MVWRCVRPSWRFLVTISAVALSLFAFLHYKPIRARLDIYLLQAQHQQASLQVSHPIVLKQRRCPSDFADIEGDFLFVTVKTTKQYHRLRLNLIASTWISDALLLKGRNDKPVVKVAILSDAVDDFVNTMIGGRMVKSRCPSSHNKTDLCCKQAAEFDLYYGEPKLAKWYCHFDDDNYVNMYQLLAELERHDASKPLYLGKSSRGMVKLKDVISGNEKGRVAFQFGTGGAGFCLTRVAMKQIKPKVSRTTGGLGLEGLCRKLPGLSDDVAVGYVTGFYKIGLTQVPTMHSHLEKLSALSQDDIRKAISLSYTRYKSYENTIQLSAFHNVTPSDPTRFLSLHAFLKPKECSRRKRAK
ncbi:putative Beta-1,3-N-acetylglucosaminyltransferase lunatic fringe [Hypsibius exemplaris]|uniref:Beta-1,3-N-acetylglucosaminyltransferase lunatic fringe n=1 Tax=Hypsibius exemplaris TaxID=2072580 RepID=A0A1W0X3K4_HYPEX|nr:putative Beta-1,3-N-acetylglucosaminyltransferase lunatic fringe [Hypsibius exemplaris]